MFQNWRRFCLPDPLKVVQGSGFGEVDVLFLDTIYQPFWLEAIHYRKNVVRLADYNNGFAGFRAGAQEVEREIISRADLVVTASHALGDWVGSVGARNTMYVPNGIDLDRFTIPDTGRPAPYADVTGPIAVFVGALGDWVDLDLIHQCAQTLPGVTFFMIGPGLGKAVSRNVPANLRYLGLIPYDKVVPFLRHAHVGLIPFRSTKSAALIEHINPLKLYEYLAAGLPVVSTHWPEIERLQSPARLCISTEDFIEAIRDVLTNPGESAHYRAFASCAGWSRRLEALNGWMESS